MASPISQTEEEKCKNAIRMVRDAMKGLGYTDYGQEIRTELADSYSFSLKHRHFHGWRILRSENLSGGHRQFQANPYQSLRKRCQGAFSHRSKIQWKLKYDALP